MAKSKEYKQDCFDFPDCPDRRGFLIVLSKYKKAFIANDYWASGVSLFLINKGDWKTDLATLPLIHLARKDELLLQGYIIITPTQPPIHHDPYVVSRPKPKKIFTDLL